MNEIGNLKDLLYCKDHNVAYEALKKLIDLSAQTDEVYLHLDLLIDMMDSSRSYVRTRAFILILKNARWDNQKKIDRIMDMLLLHIIEEKPIVARQYIQTLKCIIPYKPELLPKVRKVLLSLDTSKYKDNMRNLIDKDIQEVLKAINVCNEKK